MSNTVQPNDVYYALEPNIWQGRVIGTYARQILTFRLDDAGDVSHFVCATKTYPRGTPLWTPDGQVETDEREWPDLETFEAHLKATLLS